MSDASRLLKSWIERPLSVVADASIAVGVTIAVFILLGLILGSEGISGGLRVGLSAVVGAMLYIRARSNLLKPAPSFS